MSHSYAILSIGQVNLKTGNNKMFGVVWEGWEKDQGVNYLLDLGEGRMMVAHSASELSSLKIGKKYFFHQDQTGRGYGEATIKCMVPHNEEGMKTLAEQSGKKVITFACFK
jgi:hypothetical protein